MNNADLQRYIARLILWVFMLSVMLLATYAGTAKGLQQDDAAICALSVTGDCTDLMHKRPCLDCSTHTPKSVYCSAISCSAYAGSRALLLDADTLAEVHFIESALFHPGQFPQPDPRPPRR